MHYVKSTFILYNLNCWKMCRHNCNYSKESKWNSNISRFAKGTIFSYNKTASPLVSFTLIFSVQIYLLYQFVYRTFWLLFKHFKVVSAIVEFFVALILSNETQPWCIHTACSQTLLFSSPKYFYVPSRCVNRLT